MMLEAPTKEELHAAVKALGVPDEAIQNVLDRMHILGEAMFKLGYSTGYCTAQTDMLASAPTSGSLQ